MYFISRTSNIKYKQKVIKIEGKQLILYVLGTFFYSWKEKKVIKELKEQSVIHQQTQHSNKRYRIICTSSFWLEKQMKKQFGIAKILFQNISNPNIRNLLETFLNYGIKNCWYITHQYTMEWYTTFKLCQDSHNYFTEKNMYEKFSNNTIHDIVNVNEKVFSANKKSWLCFANILAKEIAYFSNVLTFLAFSRKYQNICVQVLYIVRWKNLWTFKNTVV